MPNTKRWINRRFLRKPSRNEVILSCIGLGLVYSHAAYQHPELRGWFLYVGWAISLGSMAILLKCGFCQRP